MPVILLAENTGTRIGARSTLSALSLQVALQKT